jgi:steroid delta-isomerase-like uncharacterized protein
MSTQPQPITDRNREIARRYFQVLWNGRDLEAATELVAEDIVGHAHGDTLHGRDTLLDRVLATHTAFADGHFAVEDTIVEGDRVAVRWTFHGTNTGEYLGAAATGRAIHVTGINILRIEKGRIAEMWIQADDLGEREQLGWIGESH